MDQMAKWIFTIIGMLAVAGIVGGIAQYAMVASLQTEVRNLKSDSKKSAGEITQQIEKEKAQKQTDSRQWQMFRREMKAHDEKWIEHDRWIHSFHGEDLINKRN